MKLQVICQECGEVLCEVEKNDVTQEDIDMYSSSVICEIDPNAVVAAVKLVK